jgi:hypothetical protein
MAASRFFLAGCKRVRCDYNPWRPARILREFRSGGSVGRREHPINHRSIGMRDAAIDCGLHLEGDRSMASDLRREFRIGFWKGIKIIWPSLAVLLVLMA